jgi:amino acid transporter
MPTAPKSETGRRPRSRRVTGLGPALCWAVVFADLGTSVYYTPGILFKEVGAHATLFVSAALVVFVLLAFKYSEVTIRYPEGGGVVTVGTHAVNGFVGLIGGLLILVDYFLTSSLSTVSGINYIGTVFPSVLPLLVPCSIAALVLIALLNLNGISADAKVTAVVAVVALLSQLAVIVAVVAHAGLGAAASAVPKVVAHPIGGVGLLTGYAGAFLAFSGLESISQLSPAMATPRPRVAPRTMVLVIVTVALTSPLLTLWSTTLLDTRHSNPDQFISLLAGYAAGPLLRAEVALTAALLLVFASNTAMIGCYHVLLALSRMRFLPELLQRRNRRRDTPHWAILVATGIPVVIVIATRGSTALLGDMYAFGLLGAFSVTCISLDVVRWRDRRQPLGATLESNPDVHVRVSTPTFALGILTSFLVLMAWTTNLFAKPAATLFGGTATVVGLGIVGLTQWRRRRRGLPGRIPHAQRLDRLRIPAVDHAHPPLVVLLGGGADEVDALVDVGLETAGDTAPLFLFAGKEAHPEARHLREIVDPYLTDGEAHAAFRGVERRGGEAVRGRLVYAVAPLRGGADGAVQRLRLLQGARILARDDDAEALTAFGATRERAIDHDSAALAIWRLTTDTVLTR